MTVVFAEFDPRGWLQLVTCGHPPPLRLTADGDLQALTPAAYATPLGLHPRNRDRARLSQCTIHRVQMTPGCLGYQGKEACDAC